MWVKLDDAMPWHPKIVGLGPQAFALYVAGLCWAAKYETDGAIPARAMRTLSPHVEAPEAAAAELVGARLWEFDECGGFRIHDFLEYQFSKAQNESRRRADLERQSRRDSARNLIGIRPESDRNPERFRSESDRNLIGIRPESDRIPSVPDPDPKIQNLYVESSECESGNSRQLAECESANSGNGNSESANSGIRESANSENLKGAPKEETEKRRTYRKRDLSADAAAVRDAIRERTGIAYPPGSFDALEAALERGEVSREKALRLVGALASDRFWGAEVRLRPSTIFRPKHLGNLLAEFANVEEPRSMYRTISDISEVL